MDKIPVARTIAQTYAFAFKRYLPILGAVWLPVLLFGVLAYYYLLPAMSALAAAMVDIERHRQQNPYVAYLPPEFLRSLGQILVSELVALLIMPVLVVGVTKEALGLRQGPKFLYLGVGKSELLVLGAILTFLAIYLGAIIMLSVVGAIIGGIIGAIVAGSSNGPADVAAIVAKTIVVVRVVTAVFYILIFYIAVRLGYLAVPISTAEGRFGLWRSWQITKGNFWRIVGVIAGTMLPLTFVFYFVWFLIFGPGIFEFMWNSQLHPEVAGPQMAAAIPYVAKNFVFIWLGMLVYAPLSYGIFVGQWAFAYRALVPAAAATAPAA